MDGGFKARNDRRGRRTAKGVLVGCVAALVCTSAACAPPAVPDPGRTTGSLGGVPGQVSLTFDDGPNPTWTPQVLDILDRYGVKGTFFVTGSQVARHPALARQIVQRGHSIANHTWSHPKLTGLSSRPLTDELAGTLNAVRDATGYVVSCARPPYGSTNANVNNTMAALGMRPALWSVDTRDWRRPGVGEIVRSALSVGNDGVILFHDGGGDRSQTVAALPQIIENLQARGIALSPVCASRSKVG